MLPFSPASGVLGAHRREEPVYLESFGPGRAWAEWVDLAGENQLYHQVTSGQVP